MKTFRVGIAIALTVSMGVVALAGNSLAQAASSSKPSVQARGPIVQRDFKHDVSPPLHLTPPGQYVNLRHSIDNPPTLSHHVSQNDTVVQRRASAQMPAASLNFDGISFPGIGCNCAPPDTNGAVGTTQYVQIVNEALQVFDKTTGSSTLGPVAISTLWTGFGGVCETNGHGDPVVIYDKAAGRWLVSQFAGASIPTSECIAVSTTGDATGTYYRYGFALGTNFYDYPKFGTWTDGYYMSMNVFNSAGTVFLGPEPFAFDRTSMLTGASASYISPVGPLGGSNPFLPADADGSSAPPVGAPESFVSFPGAGVYTTYHFHVDWTTPSNSTWTTFASPAAAPFTQLCPGTRACVPEPNGDHVDGLGDRLMFRLVYRNFGDHEAVVGNFSVAVGGVAAVRWFELRNVTAGPESVYQESTFNPDGTGRWMGSAAMDGSGDIAVGYSVSSATVVPGLRYAGRLAGDPLNSLSQGEATLFAGQGSQAGTSNRWGDYSDLTVDPVDDCTFWYTNEYYPSGSSQFNWRTRIGSFKFPTCGAPVSISKIADASSVGFGSSIGFTVTLTNHTSSDATGLAVSDSLPAGTGINWSVDAANSDPGWSVSGTAPTQAVVYTPTTLAGGATARVHVVSTTGNGSCGTYLNTASFNTANDGTGLASASEAVTGTPHVAFNENFDSVTAPAFPAGWVATQGTNTTGAPPWVTTTSSADTPPNALFSADPAGVLDNMITSPSIPISTTSAQLTFRNDYATENTYDGGVLEISVDGGVFTDILAAGGSFARGGYNATISSSYSSPLAGRQAWSGSSGGFITTTANLPAAVAGHSVQLRWRFGSDVSVASTGWWVDRWLRCSRGSDWL